MRYILTFLLISFISLNGFSQSKFSGKVVDKETNAGIAFASIFYLNDNTLEGGYTDSLGNFKIKILDLELQISCIGYQTLKLKGRDLSLNKVIQLSPIVYGLNTIEIRPRKNIILQLGYFKNKAYTKLVMNPKQALSYRKFSNYVVQHIKNEIKDDNLLITKLKFNLSNHFKKPSPVNEKGCEQTLLRVHLFEFDIRTGKPGKELLKQNLIFKNDCQTDNLVVDISSENVFLPQEGVFVGLEFIDNNRSVSSSNYPFFVVNLIDSKKTSVNTFVSNHQETWKPIMDGYKINAQFGIEVSK